MKPVSRTDSLSNHILNCTALLVCIGLIAIYAASSLKALDLYGNPRAFLEKQMIMAALGFAMIIAIRVIPFRWIERSALPLVVFTTIMLNLVFIPHVYVKVGGAFRWMNFGFIRFQPAELAKLALVMFLAKNLGRTSNQAKLPLAEIAANLGVLGLLVIPLLAQPDFGTSVLLISIAFMMVFVAGAPLRIFGMVFSLASFGIIALLFSSPYRIKRLLSFLDPWENIHTGGFQIIQSYLAFQNGGLMGVGLGESRQKLFFLPEAHTDFVVSVIGEELGFMGVSATCLLFAYLIFLGYQVCLRQNSAFRKYLAFGLTSVIAVQSIFNLGVVTGLLPTKGISLPFVSSGASSLLVFLINIGILLRLNDDAPHPSTTG